MICFAIGARGLAADSVLVLEVDRDRDLRSVGRREGHERGRVHMVDSGLGGAGLARHGNAGIWAAVPVPDWTTFSIICVRVAAVCVEIRLGENVRVGAEDGGAVGAVIFSTEYGFITVPPLAIPATTIAIWSGVT
jgi:hypothetical protein